MAVSAEKPPPIRADLEITPQYYRGQVNYIVKDPVTLKYYRLGEVEYVVLQCFQRGMGVEQTQQEVKERMGAEVSALEIYKFANQLRSSNMLKSKGMQDVSRLSGHAAKLKKHKFKRAISNYLFITIPMWDPDEMLEKLLPYFRFFLRPFFLLCWMLLAGVAAWIITTNFSTLVADAFSLLSGWNLLILSGVVFSVKFFHEMGHALTCKHFGGEVHAIGPAFLVFQPCMFTDTSDAWQFSSKWARMGVTGAGVFTEIFLASIAALVWLTSDPGFVKQLSYTTMVVCTVHTLLFNGNPLLRFDGYYILSDLVEIPNMRQKASKYLGYLFDRYLMGIDKEQPAVQEDEKQTLLIYGLLRVVYRVFIIVSIGFFLYSLFKPLGVFMWVTSAYGMIIMPIYRHGRDLARHYRRGAVKVRYMLILGVMLAALAGLWFMPIDYTVKTPVVVVPETMTVVRTPVLSRVAQVLVEEGDEVEEGDLLARLRSPRLVHRVRQVEAELGAVRVRMRKTLDEAPAEHKMHRQEEQKLRKELRDLKEKQKRLEVRAPHAGVVTNVHRLEMKGARPQQEFVQYPTDDASRELGELEGLTLEAGTGLMAVASGQSIRFQSYVYEYDMSYLSPGDEIRCVLRNLPHRVFHSKVEGVTPVDVKSIENVGITLADVGHIPVKPTPEGRQKPLVTLYLLRTRLEQNEADLPLGVTGKARVIYGEGPAGEFFFRQIVRALRLRLQKV